MMPGDAIRAGRLPVHVSRAAFGIKCPAIGCDNGSAAERRVVGRVAIELKTAILDRLRVSAKGGCKKTRAAQQQEEQFRRHWNFSGSENLQKSTQGPTTVL